MILSLKTAKKDKPIKPTISKEEKIKLKEEEKKQKQILKLQGRKVAELIEDWKDIMFETGTKNLSNVTFSFTDIVYEKYGFKANLHCPKGLTFKTLDTIREKIEDGLKCIFIYNKERLDKHMEVRIVTQISTDKKFSPPPTKDYEIYIGDRFDGSPIIVDLNKWCQVLLSGSTGGGKSKLLDCILTTQIHNHTEKDLWLFLIQLDKCDLAAYKDARICRGFADTLDKAIVILEYLMEENKKRNKLVLSIKQRFKGSNITDYNKLYPQNKQPTILVVLDEMASTAEKKSDNPIVKAKKQMIDDMLSQISQYGRSNNVFSISCLQRPTADLLNSFIKSMSNLKISFRQTNSKSSEVAMDDSDVALNLAQRVAVYKLGGYDFLQTPYIDDPLIETFIKHRLQPHHFTIFDTTEGNNRLEELKNMGGKPDKKEDKDSKAPEDTGKQDISYEQKLKEMQKEIEEKEKALAEKEKKFKEEQKALKASKVKEDFTKVDPKVQEDLDKIVEENIKKIPNFVEWTPPPRTGKEKIK